MTKLKIFFSNAAAIFSLDLYEFYTKKITIRCTISELSRALVGIKQATICTKLKLFRNIGGVYLHKLNQGSF